MAKTKASRRARFGTDARKRRASRARAKRSTTVKAAAKPPTPKRSGGGSSRKAAARKTAGRASRPTAKGQTTTRRKSPRLDRARRTLEDTVPTPPSSLNMNRHSSAARSGRAELADTKSEQRNMSPEIAGGDVDVDLEDAYFTGEEAPGGDNPTPDQDIVDDIGKALGVEYADNEPLKGSDKVVKRDKHRWELDPASSEDYKDRK